MYHCIDDAGPIELAPYRISPGGFESQLRYLADHGYYSIGLDDWVAAIAARRWLPGRPVIITFDDGYLNFLQNAWPLLERAGFTATMFVVTDRVGQTADWGTVTKEHVPLMSWQDLRSLRDRGLRIGSHTASHPSLPTLSTEDIINEGTRARAHLHQELGINATCIAVPYGHTDDRVREALGKAGYNIVVKTWGGISTWAHDPLNLPRIEIFPDDDLTKFAAKITSIRPRVNEWVPMRGATRASREFAQPHPNSAGAPMLIHPDYAQKLAARLDTLVGDFVALHSQILNSQILTVGGGARPLQAKMAHLFRQPITGKVKRNFDRVGQLSSDVLLFFEEGARVTLEIEPKLDHSLSPENCVNSLEFNFTGPSRFLQLRFDCEWVDFSSAQRYQLGIYATVSAKVLGRATLALPEKGGKVMYVVLTSFELGTEHRNFNKSGDVPNIDYINLNTEQRPTLIVSLDTTGMPDFNFKLNYLSVYFD
jgi:peptidoglycan/xylan/chitin deacetylase (PgdA/CDA1 family)